MELQRPGARSKLGMLRGSCRSGSQLAPAHLQAAAGGSPLPAQQHDDDRAVRQNLKPADGGHGMSLRTFRGAAERKSGRPAARRSRARPVRNRRSILPPKAGRRRRHRQSSPQRRRRPVPRRSRPSWRAPAARTSASRAHPDIENCSSDRSRPARFGRDADMDRDVVGMRDEQPAENIGIS